MTNKNFYVAQYDKDIWQKLSSVSLTINDILEHNADNLKQSEGALISSLHNQPLDGQWLFNITELVPLFDWIKTQFIKASKNIYDRTWRDLTWERIWVNKMSYGSSIAEHNHHFAGLVGIFYLSAPEGSAKLLSNGFRFVPETNSLVIHNGTTPHWVSKHQSEKPRIAIILEASEKI